MWCVSLGERKVKYLALNLIILINNLNYNYQKSGRNIYRTTELKNDEVFNNLGVQIFGVSGDSVSSHKKFKEKYKR